MGGITLIALVITIIVLLILAGISIAMLSGDNSILNQAGRARDITGEKSIAERVQIAYLGALANGKGNIERADLLTQLQNEFWEDKVQDSNIANDLSKVTIDGKDYSFDGTVTPGGNPPGGGGSTHTETVNGIEVSVPIPSGFTESTETGETNVVTGLVVRDSSGNDVFNDSQVKKSSSELLFAVKDNLFMLLSEASFVGGIEIVPVPRNAAYRNEGDTENGTQVSKQELVDYILEKVSELSDDVDVNIE